VVVRNAVEDWRRCSDRMLQEIIRVCPIEYKREPGQGEKGIDKDSGKGKGRDKLIYCQNTCFSFYSHDGRPWSPRCKFGCDFVRLDLLCTDMNRIQKYMV